MPIPYEQPAVALFLENFVLEPSQTNYSRGYLAGLLSLLRAAKPNSLISSSIEAVSLCFLATSTANESIASKATHSYLRSLNRLQRVLAQSVVSVSTETMMSVYLMGLYEVSFYMSCFDFGFGRHLELTLSYR